MVDFNTWKRGLDTLAKGLNDLSLSVNLSIPENTVSEKVREVFQGEVLKEFLDYYVQERFLRVVKRQFGDPQGNPSPFMPKIVEGKKSTGEVGFHRLTNPPNTADPRGVKDLWAGGFQQLWRNVSKFQTSATGSGVMAGVGPRAEVDEQNLINYPVTSGKATPSQYGSFFLAAEFGTGSFASVVRHSGKTKSDRGDGSWWFGNDRGNGWAGALFQGQEGIHFLYGKDGRTPNPIYGETLRSTLLPELKEFLANKYPALRVNG